MYVALPCGQIRLRNPGFWVVDLEIWQVIICSPLLECIGIGLDRVLATIFKERKEDGVDAWKAERMNVEAKNQKN